MNTQQAYNTWAQQYDTNENRTRDLEGKALRTCLNDISFKNCLEIGCGTGKNTMWLAEKAKHITSVDFSEKMLSKAKSKITATNVEFIQADITKDWTFTNKKFDLISFSLILEHIQNLDHIFKQATSLLNPEGHIYIGELHPFKQYTGSKARFDTENGTQVTECFTHHISDFGQSAKKYGLSLVDVNEFFDEDKNEIPRILNLLFKKL